MTHIKHFLTILLLITFFQSLVSAQNGLYQNWVRQYAGPFSVESAEDIAVDQYGNIYIASQSFDTTTSIDYAVIKYDSDGNEQWTRRYSSAGQLPDRANAIAVDWQGNVYVTGYGEDLATGPDILTIKYNSNGIQQWYATYNGPGNHWDEGKDIAVDDSGNVYVTGTVRFTSQFQSSHFGTIKYDSVGIEQWISFHTGGGEAIVLDNLGYIYVTGGDSGNFCTIKYSPNGNEEWTTTYDGPANAGEHVRDLAIDDSGNVYITGYSEGVGTGTDYATIKYNTNGVEQWAARYNSPSNGDDYVFSIVLDKSGNVYVTGTASLVYIDDHYATIKYNRHGEEQWIAYYDGPPDTYGWAMDIAVDANANMFVFGWTLDYWGTNRDYALVKYDSGGQQIAEISYDSGDDEFAVAMAIDAEGNIYVTGDSKSNVSLITTIKYTQEPTSIHEETESYPKQAVLYQNYPNPFNTLTRIRYYLPVAGPVSLKMYNLLGQEVATLAAAKKSAGEHSVIFDASELSSGVYVYRLTWNEHILARKLVLIK